MENLGPDIFGRKEPSAFSDTTGNEKLAGSPAKIKVVGVGGGGGNAVERMIKSGLAGVEFWVMNTDGQVLCESSSKNRLPMWKSSILFSSGVLRIKSISSDLPPPGRPLRRM